jgi:glutamate carboxypeptidase
MDAAKEAAVITWLDSQLPAMLTLLEELVNTDGGSYDKAGVDLCGARLTRFLADAGLEIEVTPVETYGDVIKARLDVPSANDRRPIILLGHRDTVFAKGEPERRPFTITNGIARGPGVMDMKGGLVMNAFVIAALQRFSASPAPVTMMITSDEEIASPGCRPHIEAEARLARMVFNSEPSREPHSIVKGRKGGVFMAFDVTGKAAHSGANHAEGASAIQALALKIPRLHALTDYDRGITINVGLVSGGQTVNTVAPWAQGQIDLRYVRAPERAEMIERIRAVVEAVDVPGTSATLTIRGEFLPLEETPASARLFEIYRQAGREAGFETGAEFTGGCADSGFTSAQGCPTLCSVGPVGGKGHTPEEYLLVDSLVPSAKALALSIMRAGGSLPM